MIVAMSGNTLVIRLSPSTLKLNCTCILDAQWAKSCRNGAELWRRLRAQGFQGSLRVVGEWMTGRRRAERATDQQLQKVPSARTISSLMTRARDHPSKVDTVTIAAIETRVPALVH